MGTGNPVGASERRGQGLRPPRDSSEGERQDWSRLFESLAKIPKIAGVADHISRTNRNSWECLPPRDASEGERQRVVEHREAVSGLRVKGSWFGV